MAPHVSSISTPAVGQPLQPGGWLSPSRPSASSSIRLTAAARFSSRCRSSPRGTVYCAPVAPALAEASPASVSLEWLVASLQLQALGNGSRSQPVSALAPSQCTNPTQANERTPACQFIAIESLEMKQTKWHAPSTRSPQRGSCTPIVTCTDRLGSVSGTPTRVSSVAGPHPSSGVAKCRQPSGMYRASPCLVTNTCISSDGVLWSSLHRYRCEGFNTIGGPTLHRFAPWSWMAKTS